MKKVNNYSQVLSTVPSIDLHGEDRKSAEIIVKQFLNEQYMLKNYTMIIIHGIGTGILKKQVHEVLKHDKRVENYYIDFFNVGCTVVNFKKNI